MDETYQTSICLLVRRAQSTEDRSAELERAGALPPAESVPVYRQGEVSITLSPIGIALIEIASTVSMDGYQL